MSLNKLITIFVLALSACSQDMPALSSQLNGTALPNFDLTQIKGSSHLTERNISKNKPLVVLYFSPTCPYCRAMINEIADKLNDDDDDIQILLVSNSALPEVRRVYDRFNLAAANSILLGLDYQYTLFKHYNITEVPLLIIYDKHHKVAKTYVGRVRTMQILRDIKSLQNSDNVNVN